MNHNGYYSKEADENCLNMNLVIQTENKEKDVLDIQQVKEILAPYHPIKTGEPFYLDNQFYNYLTIDNNAPVAQLIDALMQIESIVSVYQKPLDFPPM